MDTDMDFFFTIEELIKSKAIVEDEFFENVLPSNASYYYTDFNVRELYETVIPRR